MKYVFLGTPQFAATILEKLIKAGWVPKAVICNPDRPVGKKKIITPPPVKTLAQKYNISVLQPGKLETRNWKLEINKLGGVDFAIVAAYSQIIPKSILDSLPGKFIGVHPSLLPKHRGPTPIQTAILDGDKEFGTTLYLVDEKIDCGPILAQRKLLISASPPLSNSRELFSVLAKTGGKLLIGILPKFVIGKIKAVPQNEAKATYTKKFTINDAYVDLEKDDPIIVERKIRALNPEPGVWTTRDGKRMKILEAELTAEKKLKLIKIQFAGKKPVEIK
jgi:methionyl-tRNA formyltransferase